MTTSTINSDNNNNNSPLLLSPSVNDEIENNNDDDTASLDLLSLDHTPLNRSPSRTKPNAKFKSTKLSNGEQGGERERGGGGGGGGVLSGERGGGVLSGEGGVSRNTSHNKFTTTPHIHSSSNFFLSHQSSPFLKGESQIPIDKCEIDQCEIDEEEDEDEDDDDMNNCILTFFGSDDMSNRGKNKTSGREISSSPFGREISSSSSSPFGRPSVSALVATVPHIYPGGMITTSHDGLLLTGRNTAWRNQSSQPLPSPSRSNWQPVDKESFSNQVILPWEEDSEEEKEKENLKLNDNRRLYSRSRLTADSPRLKLAAISNSTLGTSSNNHHHHLHRSSLSRHLLSEDITTTKNPTSPEEEEEEDTNNDIIISDLTTDTWQPPEQSDEQTTTTTTTKPFLVHHRNNASYIFDHTTATNNPLQPTTTRSHGPTYYDSTTFPDNNNTTAVQPINSQTTGSPLSSPTGSHMGGSPLSSPMGSHTGGSPLSSPMGSPLGSPTGSGRTLTCGSASGSNSRRVAPTAINLKSLQKLRSPTSSGTIGTTGSSSFGSPMQNSANSVASTSIPQSPLGLESHFGSDTIQSSNSYQSTPCATNISISSNGLTCPPFNDSSWGGGSNTDLYGGNSSNTPQSLTGGFNSPSGQRHITNNNNPCRRASQCGSSNIYNYSRIPKVASGQNNGLFTSNLQQQSCTELPSLKDLTPIETELNSSWWNRLVALLDPINSEWEKQVMGLTLFRRLILYNVTAFDDTVNNPGLNNSKTITNANTLLSKVLILVDSGRSMLAKYALITIHDIFLLAQHLIEGSLAGECLQVCIKKSVGTTASFLSEEAQRCWKQIVLVYEPARIVTGLSGMLNSEISHSNAALRSKCILAIGLFLLRLNTNELQMVCSYRTFPTGILKPVLKSITDANLESRKFAAITSVILLNLVPDILQKFKKSLMEFDLYTITDKLKQRKFGRNWQSHFNVDDLLTSLKLLPQDNSQFENTIDNINHILTNLNHIAKHPLFFGDDNFSNEFVHTKRNAPGSLTRRDRDRDEFSKSKRSSGSFRTFPSDTAPSKQLLLDGFTRSTISPAQGSRNYKSSGTAVPSAPKPLTPLRERFNFSNRRSTSARLGGVTGSCPHVTYFGHLKSNKSTDDDSPPVAPLSSSSSSKSAGSNIIVEKPTNNSEEELVVVAADDEEEAFEEDQPWYTQHHTHPPSYVTSNLENKNKPNLSKLRNKSKHHPQQRTPTPKGNQDQHQLPPYSNRRPITPIRSKYVSNPATTPIRSATVLRNKDNSHIIPRNLLGTTMDSPSRTLASSKIPTFMTTQNRRVIGGNNNNNTTPGGLSDYPYAGEGYKKTTRLVHK